MLYIIYKFIRAMFKYKVKHDIFRCIQPYMVRNVDLDITLKLNSLHI